MLKLDFFNGSLPGTDPSLLPQGYCEKAVNADFSTGKMACRKEPLKIKTIIKSGTIRSFCKFGGKYLFFNSDIDAAQGLVLKNGVEKLYYTGDGYPKQTSTSLAFSGEEHSFPTQTRRLGVSAPSSALTINITPQGTPPSGAEVKKTVSYVYTRINNFGDESAPSPQTPVTDIYEEKGIVLSGFEKPDFLTTGEEIVAYRVYRLESSKYGAEYQWIHYPSTPSNQDLVDGDMPVSATEFVDFSQDDKTVLSASTMVLQTEEWEMPPDDLKGITNISQGIWAGFKNKTLFISEIMIPYAYPEKYKKYTEYDIVAIEALPDGAVILTTSCPYVLYGSTPDTMVLQKLNYYQGCVWKHGVTPTPIGIMYPSKDGLCLCDGSSVRIVSSKTISHEKWQEFIQKENFGVYFKGKYFCFFNDSNSPGEGFMMDIQGESGVTLFKLSSSVVFSGHDPDKGEIVQILKKNNVYSIEEWEKGNGFLSCVWLSPKLKFNDPVNFAACQILGEFGEIEDCHLKVLAHVKGDSSSASDLLEKEYEISDNHPFWLEGGFSARQWQFELSFKGSGIIESFSAGLSMEDL